MLRVVTKTFAFIRPSAPISDRPIARPDFQVVTSAIGREGLDPKSLREGKQVGLRRPYPLPTVIDDNPTGSNFRQSPPTDAIGTFEYHDVVQSGIYEYQRGCTAGIAASHNCYLDPTQRGSGPVGIECIIH